MKKKTVVNSRDDHKQSRFSKTVRYRKNSRDKTVSVGANTDTIIHCFFDKEHCSKFTL